MEPRPHCYRCDKVESLCICDRVPTVQNRTALTLVQHPRERRHPFGTARIARLGLSNLALHVVEPTDPLDVPPDAAVLFPDPDAAPLDALSPAERPAHLVVIDGTWAHASQLRRNHPALAPLRAVTLPPGPPSRYRIRREPSDEAISTIEAIARALRVLEPETEGIDALVDSFETMIDDQLTTRSRHAYSPRTRAKPRARKPLPEPFHLVPSRVALAHVELHQPRGQAERFPLRVTACRGEARFDALLSSPLPPSPPRVANMALGALAETPPLTPAEALEGLAAVIRPGDAVLAWTQPACDALRALGVEAPALSVKHVYSNQIDARVGSLDDVLRRLGDPPLDVWAPGRAGRQLAQLEAIVDHLRGVPRR